MREYKWVDLPKPLNVFTTRNTAMMNLNTGKIVQHYAANTKLTMVQKCTTDGVTYYRTQSAEHHFLNYAFVAQDFGLPNEVAPPVPIKHSSKGEKKPLTRSLDKQKSAKTSTAKGGEPKKKGFLKRLFTRK